MCGCRLVSINVTPGISTGSWVNFVLQYTIQTVPLFPMFISLFFSLVWFGKQIKAEKYSIRISCADREMCHLCKWTFNIIINITVLTDAYFHTSLIFVYRTSDSQNSTDCCTVNHLLLFPAISKTVVRTLFYSPYFWLQTRSNKLFSTELQRSLSKSKMLLYISGVQQSLWNVKIMFHVKIQWIIKYIIQDIQWLKI